MLFFISSGARVRCTCTRLDSPTFKKLHYVRHTYSPGTTPWFQTKHKGGRSALFILSIRAQLKPVSKLLMGCNELREFVYAILQRAFHKGQCSIWLRARSYLSYDQLYDNQPNKIKQWFLFCSILSLEVFSLDHYLHVQLRCP